MRNEVKPVIDTLTFPNNLHEGQRFNILCSVIKGDSPIIIKWFKDGRQIGIASDIGFNQTPTFSNHRLDANDNNNMAADLTGISIIHVTQYTSTLIFESLNEQHTGNYTCEAA